MPIFYLNHSLSQRRPCLLQRSTYMKNSYYLSTFNQVNSISPCNVGQIKKDTAYSGHGLQKKQCAHMGLCLIKKVLFLCISFRFPSLLVIFLDMLIPPQLYIFYTSFLFFLISRRCNFFPSQLNSSTNIINQSNVPDGYWQMTE